MQPSGEPELEISEHLVPSEIADIALNMPASERDSIKPALLDIVQYLASELSELAESSVKRVKRYLRSESEWIAILEWLNFQIVGVNWHYAGPVDTTENKTKIERFCEILGERRGEQHSIIYEGFSDEIKDAGRDLRATQTAIMAARWCVAKKPELSDMFRQVHEEGRPIDISGAISRAWPEYATPENNFREGDCNLDKNDPFRMQTEGSLMEMLSYEALMGGCLEFENVEPGMPRTAKEAMQTNYMTKLISEHIEGTRKEATKVLTREGLAFRIREGLKKLDMLLVTLIMKWKGVKSEETEQEEKEIMGNIWGVLTYLAKYGGKELLSQIQREAKAKENGGAENETLDNPLVRKLFGHFSKSFIAGTDVKEVLENKNIQRMLENGMDLVLAPEIEGTGNREAAERNYGEFKKCLEDMPEEHTHMSMKLTALAMCEYEGDFEDLKDPPGITEERIGDIKKKLTALCDIAHAKGKFICIDMEQFFYKDTTFRIVTELLEENPLLAENLGIVIQAYQKESEDDIRAFTEWAGKFRRQHGKKIKIRLVKGAYSGENKDPRRAKEGFHRNLETTWHGEEREDWETRNTENPILSLEETQASYTRIMKFLEQHTDCITTDYGLHNPNHMAQIIQTWMNNGQTPSQREIQTLMGMYDGEKLALRGLVHQRAYIPFGNLGKILEYMYRRFEELEKDKGFLKTEFDLEGQPTVAKDVV